VTLFKVELKGQALNSGLQAAIMTEPFSKIRGTVLVGWYGQIIRSMKESGKMEGHTAKES
jgi:hypothetical protein